jgi:16S rRNA (guanine(966)-N(2))-methyltransferase RsmD
MAGGLVPGAVVLDLFAGTGSLGLEALSRGAEHCIFCDYSAESLAIARKNIAYCHMEGRSTLMMGSFEKTLPRLQGKAKVDVVLLDPPYRNEFYVKCILLLEELGILADGGAVIAEHDAKMPLPCVIGGFAKTKEKKYGGIGVTFFEKNPPEGGVS